MTKGFYKTGN